ncbi:hypothetical protein LTS08_002187 [Lithohypha guttulata]|uniref:uncharacterized protein n=1 Tax=Lithohypha guttulata TaxID=1690604 RepID=UPI002DE19D57|nr:hypothetical protein LTR51_004297 [Lithohypha guttulata]KAK5104299.1 hypothetical protein LTS08_002187 [Lithohypha guttulata]
MAFNTNTDIWIAGAFAAFTVDLLVYPLDTLKTRIQSPDYKKLYTENGRASRALFRGLYQGIGSIILVTLPSSGAFFTTYEALKYTLNDAVPPNSTLYMPQPVINAISSGGAELVSCAILTPAEVIKQNAQVAQKTIKGVGPTLSVLKEFRKHPFRLWSGYTALAGRNLPFTAMQFPVFEHLKSHFMEKRRRQKGAEVDGIFERASITSMSAGIAGSGAAWITTPIDVIKTRMMLAAGNRGQTVENKNIGTLLTEGLSSKSSKGIWETAKEVGQTDGLRGFFRGAALRAVWTAVGSGLYLGVYEGGRFYLEDARKSKEEKNHIMPKDWSSVQVGVGRSRSQGEAIKKSGWQDDSK